MRANCHLFPCSSCPPTELGDKGAIFLGEDIPRGGSQIPEKGILGAKLARGWVKIYLHFKGTDKAFATTSFLK